jgi:phosphoribosyl-AMP cyclohydrolase
MPDLKNTTAEWLEQIRWNSDGLVPAIAQDANNGRVLMMAWMNADALQLTVEKQQAVYWSRSRQALWRKGESSGNQQLVKRIELDCDGDTILLQVDQKGGIACHTGRNSCMFRQLENGVWCESEPVLKSPEEMYSND